MPGLDRIRDQLCVLSADPGGSVPTDVQLLERFVRRNDEVAFAALVRRHGPMVLGVCRRVLRDLHEAEDAFQATFLVLARKSASLSRPEALANWLHGVAYRTAVKARTRAARWRMVEEACTDPAGSGGDGLEELAWRELQAVLDEEIRRLPGRYRNPVVLCCLQGQTYQEAAQRLGCPAGTVAGRLARARERLRGRLARRGFTLSAGLFAGLLSARTASAVLPPELIPSTARAATRFAVGESTVALSGPVVALAKGVLQAMLWTKLQLVFGACLLVGIGLACALFAFRTSAQEGRGGPPVAGLPLPDAGEGTGGAAPRPPGKPRATPPGGAGYPATGANPGEPPPGSPARPDDPALRREDARDEVALCKARLDGKQAELEEVKLLHEKARYRSSRLQKLRGANVVPEQNIEEARFDEKVMAARVAAKEAEVTEASIYLRQAERRLSALDKKPGGGGGDSMTGGVGLPPGFGPMGSPRGGASPPTGPPGLGTPTDVSGGSSPMGAPTAGGSRTGAPTRQAKLAYEAVFVAFQAGRADAEQCYLWSKRWLEAERAGGNRKAGKAHEERMRQLRDLVQDRYREGKAGREEVAAAEYYWQEARTGG